MINAIFKDNESNLKKALTIDIDKIFSTGQTCFKSTFY